MAKISNVAGGATAAVAVIALMFSAPTIAQSSYGQEVDRLLNLSQSIANSRGYSSTHSRANGQLNNGEERTVTLDLDAGTTYMIVGQCDTDCSDIDMWLYDEEYNLVDSDEMDDDSPILEITPRWDARFSLRTRMISCSQQPCYYGVGVYGQ